MGGRLLDRARGDAPRQRAPEQEEEHQGRDERDERARVERRHVEHAIALERREGDRHLLDESRRALIEASELERERAADEQVESRLETCLFFRSEIRESRRRLQTAEHRLAQRRTWRANALTVRDAELHRDVAEIAHEFVD